MWQYFHRAVAASALNRMAVTGRDILQWLAEPYVLATDRRTFEANLYQIAEAGRGVDLQRGGHAALPADAAARNVYLQGPPPRGARRDPVFARGSGLHAGAAGRRLTAVPWARPPHAVRSRGPTGRRTFRGRPAPRLMRRCATRGVPTSGPGGSTSCAVWSRCLR